MSNRPEPGLWLMRLAYWFNRARLARLRRVLRDRIAFGPGCDVWAGSLVYRGRGRTVFGRGCAVDRNLFPFLLEVEEGGLVRLMDEVWVRGKYRPNVLTCMEGAKITVGPRSILNGVTITARESIVIGERAMLGWDVTILDSNLHPIENEEPIRTQPITIGDHVWIGNGATILPGAAIGSHSVIGARSIVASPLPSHVLAAGAPAQIIREIGDRDRC